MNGVVLTAYDGSANAERAVDQAAALFAGADAVVLTVWQSVGDATAAARVALPDDVVRDGLTRLDAAAEDAAWATAREGAERATAHGLSATPVAVRADRNVAAAVLDAADDHNARCIVVGSRGRSGGRALVLGSVSNAVVHQSARPVVVVPSVDGAGGS